MNKIKVFEKEVTNITKLFKNKKVSISKFSKLKECPCLYDIVLKILSHYY